MAKYRKLPVEIDAVQWTPEQKFREGFVSAMKLWEETGVFTDESSPTGFSILTLAGKHEVTPGDWIITGVKGEKYPVKPDIFEMTYEKV